MSSKQKIEKFKLLESLLKNKLDVAASNYSMVMRMLNEEIEKNKQLSSYKQNYMASMFKEGETFSMDLIKQKDLFVSHIARILVSQQHSIHKLKEELVKKKSTWITYKNKYDKMSEYINKMEQEWRDELELREQKELDTLSTDLYAYKNLSK